MRPEAHSFTAKDGRELTFLFDHGGIVATEKIGEGNFGEIMSGMAEGKMGCMAAMIAGGLRAHHPDFSVEDAWDLMDAEDKAMGTALGEALKSSRPGQMAVKAVGANPPKARTRRGTGTRSSPRGSKKA